VNGCRMGCRFRNSSRLLRRGSSETQNDRSCDSQGHQGGPRDLHGQRGTASRQLHRQVVAVHPAHAQGVLREPAGFPS
jgi:hypothetical protein